MRTFLIPALLLFLFSAAFALPVFSIMAQDGTVPGSDAPPPPSDGTKVDPPPVSAPPPSQELATSSPSAAGTSKASSTNPNTTTLRPGSSGITPPPPTNEVVPPPSPVDSYGAEQDPGMSPLLLGSASAAALLLGIFGIYRLQKQKTEEKEEEDSQCLNLRRIVEKKFNEIVDLKGQLKGKAEEVARSTLRSSVAGTPAAAVLETLERAETEYNRLRRMLEECEIEWKVGDIKIAKVLEIENAGSVIQGGMSEAVKEHVLEIPWLAPHFADDAGHLRAVVQAFVVETPEHRIMIDTCVGNFKERKSIPEWGNLDVQFLERLKKAGYRREDIDIVFCTHLHFDHVGWNTMLVEGKWVPTFPNAKYLFVEKEFNYWKSRPGREVEDDHAGITDSVLPVVEAGLAELVSENYQISKEVSLIPTPGHTPFHSSVLIESGEKKIVITGDALHHPCQIARPDWAMTAFDTDKEQAYRSRIKLLEYAADGKTLVIGSHFSTPAGGYIKKEGSGFRFIPK